MKTFATLGSRQQELLKALLANPAGLTVDQLRRELAISRNAVIQHLQSLERLDLVDSSMSRSSIGRPGRLYVLSSAGRELFPRHYPLFSNLLLRGLREKYGEQELAALLEALGRDLAERFSARVNGRGSLGEKVEEIALVMQELGYETAQGRQAGQGGEARDGLAIIASNCVFHKLAQECPTVCRLDLALLESLSGAPVRHQECMARGGACCRFRFDDGGT